jgi:hypothetical protein
MCPVLVLEFFTKPIRQEEVINRIPTRKEEVKLSLLANDMILYSKDPKDSTKRLICDKHFQHSNSI